MPTTYVVYASGLTNPFKHFVRREHATAFAASLVQNASAERADVFAVQDITDARLAIDAVKSGNAELVETRSAKATAREVGEAHMRAFRKAQAEGPAALLKFLGLPLPQAHRPPEA